MSKPKMGMDPLAWIIPTREEGLPAKEKREKTAAIKPAIAQKKQGGYKQLKEEETQRQTYHLQKELIDKVQAYAYWERLGISEVVNLALSEYFKNKKVKPIPKKRSVKED